MSAILRNTGSVIALAGLIVCMMAGCDRRDDAAAKKRTPTSPSFIRVASLVPAATDLILSMGAGDHLVAVSNYDRNRLGAKGLPAVGDYLSTDWEQLAVLKPNVMIVAMAPDRMSAGLKQRAAELGIHLVNAKIDGLKDIFTVIGTLGRAMDEQAKASALAGKLQNQLDGVRLLVADKPKIKTLIMLDAQAKSAVGRNNYLNDLLEIAGGENAIPAGGGAYPNIDHEMLMSLRPDVVLQLLPEAPPQVLNTAQSVWKSLPRLPAVAHDRVVVLTQWWVLMPGGHVGELAEAFAKALHSHVP